MLTLIAYFSRAFSDMARRWVFGRSWTEVVDVSDCLASQDEMSGRLRKMLSLFWPLKFWSSLVNHFFVISIQSKHLQKKTRAHGFHQNDGTRRDVKKIISVRGEAHVTIKLFRSARTSCITFGWFVRPVCKKNLDHLYTGMYALNHEKTHQTNPMAPWDPLDALLTP